MKTPLPYITLYIRAHTVVGVDGDRTFSEPAEDPKSWATGFLMAYKFAGGDGEVLDARNLG